MRNDRAELASVVVVLQASFSIAAGLIAMPFAVVEPGYRLLSLVTIAVAGVMLWLVRNLRRERQWARTWLIALESLSLLSSLLLMMLPIGALRGPVPLLVNLVLPCWVIWLLKVSPSPSGGGQGRGLVSGARRAS